MLNCGNIDRITILNTKMSSGFPHVIVLTFTMYCNLCMGGVMRAVRGAGRMYRRDLSKIFTAFLHKIVEMRRARVVTLGCEHVVAGSTHGCRR